ncbi:MAG: carbohydrate-binding protein [Bacteroidota bacterium]|nr:carbohydrate-binding protein [Bacteroidota bacterium]
MIKPYLKLIFATFLMSVSLNNYGQNAITNDTLLTSSPGMYERANFEIKLTSSFSNAYDAGEIALDMVISSPSGKALVLPCFYVSGNSTASVWNARFLPQETGVYSYYFRLSKNSVSLVSSVRKSFKASPTAKQGIIHKNNNWTFKFDNGEPFRGIGENVGWEARDFENQTYKYEYFLPKLAANGATFFRSWMHIFNMPLEWKAVANTKFYTSSGEYFNPSAIARIDKFFELIDTLGLHAMLSLDVHGGLMTANNWPASNYNVANGGPCSTPLDFFTLDAAKAKYKNRIRYIIARWGYSAGLGAFEFFNEIDNASYASGFGSLTGSAADASITAWHTEMSKYIKDTDPYGHLVTTSISHREISGLNNVPDMDFNQKHIYWGVLDIINHINNFTQPDKPYVIGEYGFSADGAYTNDPTGAENDFTFKRGLWYGMFTNTPILPMTWWWEAFDSRNMTLYFRGVRDISNQMLGASKGNITKATVIASGVESYAVKCGNRYFIYLLNSGTGSVTTIPQLTVSDNVAYTVKTFNPSSLVYTSLSNVSPIGGTIMLPSLAMASRYELVYIIAPVGDELGVKLPYSGTAISIPGKVEVENFDKGGELVAYHDFDATNVSGKYRTTEGVDIDAVTDGGYCVSNIVKAEWLKYSVNIQNEGVYSIDVRVAAADTGKSFRIRLDNQYITGKISVPNTGGLQNWQTVSVPVSVPSLTAGAKTLTIEMGASGFAIDYVNFTLTNKAPKVSITSPANNTTYTSAGTIDITANASDDDGSVAKVQFFNGSIKLGEVVSAPYLFHWSAGVGTYKLVAVVTDDKGLTSLSDTIKGSVSSVPSLPGTIQAEDYDLGGEGVGYHDLSSGNKFGNYRSDDVDLEQCTDTGGGYDLGDFQTGEWTQYTVNVSQTGTYTVEFRVTTQMDGTSLAMLVDGQNVTGTISVSNTGGWQTWTTVSKTGISLTKGQHVIRLSSVVQYLNINYVTFSLSTAVNDAFHDNTVTCYPNPVTTTLWFNNMPVQVTKMSIINMLGEVVKACPVTDKSTDMSALSPGIYNVNLISAQNEVLRRFKIVKVSK